MKKVATDKEQNKVVKVRCENILTLGKSFWLRQHCLVPYMYVSHDKSPFKDTFRLEGQVYWDTRWCYNFVTTMFEQHTDSHILELMNKAKFAKENKNQDFLFAK